MFEKPSWLTDANIVYTTCMAIAFIIYLQVGAWKYVLFTPSMTSDETKKLVWIMKNPDNLIMNIKSHIRKNKNNHTAWYLLAKLYVSQNDNENALQAINHALRLKKRSIYERLKQVIHQKNMQKKLIDS